MSKNLVLILGFFLLTAIPLFMSHKAKQDGTLFMGTDDQAGKIINEIRADYMPWVHPLWKPPSAEIESLLFGIQAAIGAGLIGYCLGYHRAKHTGSPRRKA